MSGLLQSNRLAAIVEVDSSKSDDEIDAQTPVRFRIKKPPDETRATSVNAQIRHSYYILKDMVFPNQTGDPKNRDTILSDTSTIAGGKWRKFGFLTIRVLFWDIMLSFLDTVSDFAQGVALFSMPEKRIYGIVTLAINWIPGFPAAIHLVSMYRTEFPWYSTILYAVLLIVLYPIVPILAFANLLWVKPKINTISSEADFRGAEYRSVNAHAISGCIESPIQIIYQMWLVLNGVVLLQWNDITSVSITDWEGNTVFLPITASFCMILSIVAVVKATLEVNLIRVHVDGIWSWKTCGQYIMVIFDHLPVLVSGAFFRIASLIMIMTYLNSFGFIAIGAFWLFNTIASQFTFGERTHKVPIWLISFVAIFIPICLTTSKLDKPRSRQKMIQLQYKVFKIQSLIALACYGSSLVAMLVIINKLTEDFKYNPDIILNNWNFNLIVFAILAGGVISVLLSLFAPRATKLFECCKTKSNKPTDNLDEVDGIKQPKRKSPSHFKMVWSILLLGLAVGPLVVPAIVFMYSNASQTTTSYIYYKPRSNHTKIVQATTLNKFNKTVYGTTKDLLNQGIDQDDADQAEDQWSGRSDEIANGEPFLKTTREEKSSKFNQIVLISRELWELKKELVLTNIQPAAVIITDSERLRPSSPLPDIGTDSHIPILLVREEDIEQLPHDGFQHQIWLAPNNQSIPDPDWSCKLDNGRGGCLPPIFNEGFIYGHQYRSKTCYWGGHACVGYTNVQQEEDYCNGPETTVCPVDLNQGFGSFQYYTMYTGERRNLRYNPAHCISDLQLKVDECDKGTSNWSNWLDWTIDNKDQDLIDRSRRRYCYIKHHECILEERMFNKCCDPDYNQEEFPFSGTICKNDIKVPRC